MIVGKTASHVFNPKLRGIIVAIKEEKKRVKVRWFEGTDILYTCIRKK